jgi:Ca-activated chloride channel family protein
MPPNRLPLVKQAMKMLVKQLNEKDRVSIVVYAGASGLVLPPTPGNQHETILGAIENLSAGGSTNGGEGIKLAYKVAKESFHKDGINRVLLATDGDFNVGTTDVGELVSLVENEKKSGVFLTVLGVGDNNVKDDTMEKLADRGNGNYAYLDSVNEAKKVLVQQAGSTLITIAKDVKIQVELNPKKVSQYRLIGYENRMLRAEDFKDDKKDAGEIGAGHSVTALYEIVPAAGPGPTEPLKYQTAPAIVESNETCTIKLRYKEPKEDQSREMVLSVVDAGKKLDAASPDFRFASSVAAFGMMLRGSPHKGDASYALVRQLADGAKGKDPDGYRAEFVRLVSRAETLK